MLAGRARYATIEAVHGMSLNGCIVAAWAIGVRDQSLDIWMFGTNPETGRQAIVIQ